MSENMDVLIDGKTGKMWNLGEPCGVGPFVEADLGECSEIPADHPTRKALEIGRMFLDRIRDDQEIDDNAGVVHPGRAEQGGPEFLRIWLKQKEPKPLTGLDWLKSLPDGTVATAGGCDSFVKLKDGLHWIACGEVWAWSDERDWTFGIPGRTACEDNISILWTPNPEEEA